MFQDNNIVQKQIIGRSNKFNEYYTCNLCKIDIIGVDQLKTHLNGSKHSKNMMRENMKNKAKEKNVTEADEIQQEDSNLPRSSTSHSISDITIPAKLCSQTECAGCLEKMNGSIEKICGFESLETTINYTFKDKSLLLQAMTHAPI